MTVRISNVTIQPLYSIRLPKIYLTQLLHPPPSLPGISPLRVKLAVSIGAHTSVDIHNVNNTPAFATSTVIFETSNSVDISSTVPKKIVLLKHAERVTQLVVKTTMHFRQWGVSCTFIIARESTLSISAVSAGDFVSWDSALYLSSAPDYGTVARGSTPCISVAAEGAGSCCFVMVEGGSRRRVRLQREVWDASGLI